MTKIFSSNINEFYIMASNSAKKHISDAKIGDWYANILHATMRFQRPHGTLLRVARSSMQSSVKSEIACDKSSHFK